MAAQKPLTLSAAGALQRLQAGDFVPVDKARTALGTAGAVTIDLAVSNEFGLSPTAAVTLSVTNDYNGAAIFLRVTASAFTVTWPGTVKWAGGVAPTLPTVAGHVVSVTLKRESAGNFDGFVSPEMF